MTAEMANASCVVLAKIGKRTVT